MIQASVHPNHPSIHPSTARHPFLPPPPRPSNQPKTVQIVRQTTNDAAVSIPSPSPSILQLEPPLVAGVERGARLGGRQNPLAHCLRGGLPCVCGVVLLVGGWMDGRRRRRRPRPRPYIHTYVYMHVCVRIDVDVPITPHMHARTLVRVHQLKRLHRRARGGGGVVVAAADWGGGGGGGGRGRGGGGVEVAVDLFLLVGLCVKGGGLLGVGGLRLRLRFFVGVWGCIIYHTTPHAHDERRAHTHMR